MLIATRPHKSEIFFLALIFYFIFYKKFFRGATSLCRKGLYLFYGRVWKGLITPYILNNINTNLDALQPCFIFVVVYLLKITP